MIFKILLSFNLAFGTMGNPPTSTERQYLSFTNFLSNPGFESGKAGWSTTTTAFTITTTASEVFDGQRAAKWNPAGAESLTSPSWTPKANAPGNGVGFCRVRSNADADYNFEIYDGSNVIATVDIPASTSYQLVYLNFPVVGGTSYSVRVTSAGDDDEIQVDNCGIGYAEGWNIADISQAQFIGSAYIAGTTNCQWTRASTSLGAFGTDADCPGTTVELNPGPGTIQTTDTDLPQFTVNDLPPGNYRVVITGYAGVTSTAGSSFAIYDGTSTNGRGFVDLATGSASQFVVDTEFQYTNSGNRTFSLHGASTTSTLNVFNNNTLYRLSFSIYRYPLASQIAVKADTTAMSWSGYHDNTCSWSTTSTSLVLPGGDATCALVERTNSNFGTVTSVTDGTGPQMGITFTPKKVGRYYVCVTANGFGSTPSTQEYRLWDGTTTIAEAVDASDSIRSNTKVCGIYSANSTSSVSLSLQSSTSVGTFTFNSFSSQTVLEWSIIALNQSLPAPLIRQSVVTSSNGVTGIEAAKLVCSSSSAILTEFGSWLTSIGNVSAGGCDITIDSGIFSAAPICTGNINDNDFTSTGAILNFRATSATAISVDCELDDSTACTNYDFNIHCIGPR